MPAPAALAFLLPSTLLQWSTGDLWRVGVAWCSELPDGNNMSVTVNRSDELISGYKVEIIHGEGEGTGGYIWATIVQLSELAAFPTGMCYCFIMPAAVLHHPSLSSYSTAG